MGSSLLAFMSCEKLSRNLYRGQSKDLKTGQVYGGQVLGQAINAASNAVDDSRLLRSAHAYFLRKGDVDAPIIYHVDRALDGGSVSSRVIIASQHGKPILHLSASYHKEESGLDYYPRIELPLAALDKAIANEDFFIRHFQADFLDVVRIPKPEKSKDDTIRFWVKTKEQLPDTNDAQNAVLAYISDMGLLYSTLAPHKLLRESRPKDMNIMMASIDHAIWFHRPFRADDWFFYECTPISNSGARGLSQGRLYDRQGHLFASTTQEGLIRIIDKK